MSKKYSKNNLLIIASIIAITVIGGSIALEYLKTFEQKIENIITEQFFEGFIDVKEKLTYLEEQVHFLRKENVALKEQIEKKPKEIIRREIIREKSQDTLLTEAVAEVTPAVVSIAAAKDVPLLEIEYINPFGDDPFFKDFNIRVPRYRQKGTTRKQVGSGTGFLVAADGRIITNRHVVNDTEAEYTVLLQDGTQKKATVTYRDPDVDLAVLKIQGSGYPSVALGDSDKLKLGQSVFAVGNALGEYSNSVSVGIVSGLDRNIVASGIKITGVIQTDAAINPGNSGGPLVNLQGEIIGINVATVIGSENIGFSIPINLVKRFSF